MEVEGSEASSRVGAVVPLCPRRRDRHASGPIGSAVRKKTGPCMSGLWTTAGETPSCDHNTVTVSGYATARRDANAFACCSLEERTTVHEVLKHRGSRAASFEGDRAKRRVVSTLHACGVSIVKSRTRRSMVAKGTIFSPLYSLLRRKS